jgi:NAD(P)-dependent dehydrogenase (short-subunit alcohol dehydrogenase family)
VKTPARRDFGKTFDLSGRVAVITGGAGLLGSQYADALAQAGANVVIVDRRLAEGKAVATALTTQHGVEALALRTDITQRASVARMARTVQQRLGRIDILINNAALTVRGGATGMRDYFAPFEDYSVATWERALAVNLTGMFLCCQAVGRRMVAQGRGVIVNISSTYGVVAPDQRIYRGIPNPHNPRQPLNTPISYSVTKGAVLSLTRYLATYWADRNIRVNALTPGGTYENHDRRFVANYASRTPLGRMARSDEYRGAMLFLVSDASSYMTGANLVVDGGWTAW